MSYLHYPYFYGFCDKFFSFRFRKNPISFVPRKPSVRLPYCNRRENVLFEVWDHPAALAVLFHRRGMIPLMWRGRGGYLTTTFIPVFSIASNYDMFGCVFARTRTGAFVFESSRVVCRGKYPAKQVPANAEKQGDDDVSLRCSTKCATQFSCSPRHLRADLLLCKGASLSSERFVDGRLLPVQLFFPGMELFFFFEQCFLALRRPVV